MNASTEIENNVATDKHAELIAGLDEVGRGAVSGPLVVGCVVRRKNTPLLGMRDSKCLSEKKRHEIIHDIFLSAVHWSVGIVSAEEIDASGMAWAVPECFSRALAALPIEPDLIFCDGRDLKLPQNNIHYTTRADATHATVAAASIIAKVTRDILMREYDDLFPEYGFASHKGYGTPLHADAIAVHGIVDGVHRKQFTQSLMRNLSRIKKRSTL